MAKAVLGYGLVKLGKLEGIATLTGAVDWFEKSKLLFPRTWYALWLADAHLRLGDPGIAGRLAEEVLPRTRERGYRYFEGMAERLLGTSLVPGDPLAAASHREAGGATLVAGGGREEGASGVGSTRKAR